MIPLCLSSAWWHPLPNRKAICASCSMGPSFLPSEFHTVFILAVNIPVIIFCATSNSVMGLIPCSPTASSVFAKGLITLNIHIFGTSPSSKHVFSSSRSHVFISCVAVDHISIGTPDMPGAVPFFASPKYLSNSSSVNGSSKPICLLCSILALSFSSSDFPSVSSALFNICSIFSPTHCIVGMSLCVFGLSGNWNLLLSSFVPHSFALDRIHSKKNSSVSATTSPGS